MGYLPTVVSKTINLKLSALVANVAAIATTNAINNPAANIDTAINELRYLVTTEGYSPYEANNLLDEMYWTYANTTNIRDTLAILFGRSPFTDQYSILDKLSLITSRPLLDQETISDRVSFNTDKGSRDAYAIDYFADDNGAYAYDSGVLSDSSRVADTAVNSITKALSDASHITDILLYLHQTPEQYATNYFAEDYVYNTI